MGDIHKVKINPEFLEAIKSGEKTFEIRKNDRDYKVGDFLVFLDLDGSHTGVARNINYISDFEQKEGYIVMAISSCRIADGHYCVNAMLCGYILVCPQFSTEYKINEHATILRREKGDKDWIVCSAFNREKEYLFVESCHE